MPIEYTQLLHQPEPMTYCPKCGAIFRSFLRGVVQSSWRKFWGKPYCACICQECKEIVGHEAPQGTEVSLANMPN